MHLIVALIKSRSFIMTYLKRERADMFSARASVYNLSQDPPGLSLADNFSVYPSPFDPDFQRLYASKLEFAQLASYVGEPTPVLGQFYSYQELMKRHFQHFDRAFNISDAGVGKARMFICPAEYFRKLYEELGDAAPIRGVIILVANAKLIKDVKNQIACSSKDYQGLTVSQVMAKIDKWYNINTYRKFVDSEIYDNTLTRMRPKEYIAKKFGNMFLHIDEAQKVRIESKAVGMGGEGGAGRTAAALARRANRPKGPPKDPDRMYKGLLYLIDNAPGLKRMISSATPIYNNRKELSRTGNFALTPELRMDETKEYDDEEIRKRFNGVVVYVKQINPLVSLIERGNLLVTADSKALPTLVSRETKITGLGTGAQLEGVVSREPDEKEHLLWASLMKGPQLDIYQRHWEGGSRGVANLELRQISLLVFPNGTFGGSLDTDMDAQKVGEGLADYVYRNKKEDRYEPKALFDQWIPASLPDYQKLEILSQYSAIYTTLFRHIHQHTIDRANKKAFGTLFIFCHLVNGPGAIILSILLERVLGYTAYYGESAFSVGENQAKSILSNCGESEKNGADESMAETHSFASEGMGLSKTGFARETASSSYATSSSGIGLLTSERKETKESKERKRTAKVKAPVMTLSKNTTRYALLPRNDNKFDNILKVNNSKLNWNGDYLHVVIATPQAAVGINVANATEFHSVTVDPNEKGTYQEVMRIVRASSFDAILQNSGQKQVQVKIHHHVAITPNDVQTDVRSINISTVKDAMYEGARMELAYAALKSVAFDAYININRNRWTVNGTLQPGQPGYYTLATQLRPEEFGSDRSTYYINYAEREIANIHSFMNDTFSKQFSIDLASIIMQFPKIPKIVLERAIEQLLHTHMQTRDPLGNISRIYEENDVYFLSNEASEEDAKLVDLNYVNSVNAHSSLDFVDWINTEVDKMNKGTLDALQNASFEVIEQYKRILNTKTQINLVESGIEQIIRGKTLTNLQLWTFIKYGLYIHRLIDPKTPGRKIYVHRLYYLYTPILKQGQASRITGYRGKDTNRILDSYTRTNSDGTTTTVGTWRNITRTDANIKNLVLQDIREQVRWYQIKGYKYIMTKFKRDYRRAEFKGDGKISTQTILNSSSFSIKERYDILYELKIPTSDIRKGHERIGYVETYTWADLALINPYRPLAPDNFKDTKQVQDFVVQTLQPVISAQAFNHVMIEFSKGVLQPALFYLNISNTTKNNKGSLEFLIRYYMKERGRLLQRNTNKDWYMNAGNPKTLPQPVLVQATPPVTAVQTPVTTGQTPQGAQGVAPFAPAQMMQLIAPTPPAQLGEIQIGPLV